MLCQPYVMTAVSYFSLFWVLGRMGCVSLAGWVSSDDMILDTQRNISPENISSFRDVC